jgi:murein L,D-transpeptidase YcbB/YkuD
MGSRVGWCGFGVVVLAALMTIGCGRVDNSEHVAALRALVEERPRWVGTDALDKRLWAIEREFYQTRGFTPAWIDGDRPAPQLTALLEQLRQSDRHGLDPASYGTAEVEPLLAASRTTFRGVRIPVADIPDLDARLTHAYLLYAADLLGWTSSSRAVDPNWRSSPKKEDLAARLSAAVNGNRLAESLAELAPTHPQYQGLQVALAHEREHPTGRENIIRLNLERWRWAPRDLGARYVLVNVPAYQLQVMEGDRPALAMRVVVGSPETPTPLFSDEMTYVVFSPTWSIPESIIRQETLPRIARDSDYLERNNIEVVSGREVIDPATIDWSDEDETEALRFRQKPGPDNALGLVKFIFPNNFSVYLHDTPADALFARDRRAFSHGCVRVENPVGLARYVLGDQPEWTDARIGAAMTESTEQTARLKTPLPVHIGYWTAWVEPDGKTVTYTDDPYAIDAKHARVRGLDPGVAAVKDARVSRRETGASAD